MPSGSPEASSGGFGVAASAGEAKDAPKVAAGRLVAWNQHRALRVLRNEYVEAHFPRESDVSSYASDILKTQSADRFFLEYKNTDRCALRAEAKLFLELPSKPKLSLS